MSEIKSSTVSKIKAKPGTIYESSLYDHCEFFEAQLMSLSDLDRQGVLIYLNSVFCFSCSNLVKSHTEGPCNA